MACARPKDLACHAGAEIQAQKLAPQFFRRGPSIGAKVQCSSELWSGASLKEVNDRGKRRGACGRGLPVSRLRRRLRGAGGARVASAAMPTRLHVSGDVTVPGDKSITHRALMFSAAARGESRLRGLLPGADCRSTASVLRALGCDVPDLPADGSEIASRGRGIECVDGARGVAGLRQQRHHGAADDGPARRRPFASTLTGDDSLRGRPMRRITEPLARMGARFREAGAPGCLPIEVVGGPLHSIDYASPKASAQIKSAVLLAGLGAGVPVSVTEPMLSRDHTERMLEALGETVDTLDVDTARRRAHLPGAQRARAAAAGPGRARRSVVRRVPGRAGAAGG